MTKISLKLDQYLKSHNITRYALSKKADVSHPAIRSYCTNAIRRYDADILEKICDALNCDITDIIECVDVEKD